MKNEIFFFWVQNLKWATAHLSRRLGAGQAQGARGACVGSAGARWAGALGARRQARQACWGAGPCSGRWGVGRALGARLWHGQACCRRADARASGRRAGRAGERGAQASGRRWRARPRVGERQLGAGAGGRQGAGRAAGRRWARGARAAWAPGLALGSALGALGPVSIRFDSFFFLSHQMNTVHCKIKFF